MTIYPTLNMASIITTMFVPSANYNEMSCWYGNIDAYPANLRGNLEDDLFIEEEVYAEVAEEYFMTP